MRRKYDVAAYIWPAYTGKEPRTRIFWPEGVGEWQTVRGFNRTYPHSTWPRRPLWGYQDEADPRVMERQIAEATSHGVNVFIYDWYWYDRRPFLEQCLNEGFLGAENHNQMKFYLMWANHDALSLWDRRTSADGTLIWYGSQPRGEFERATRRMIDQYFRLPCYYTIDGKPVLMIYDVPNLVKGLGGLEATKDALAWLREECVRAGLPGLHLQFAMWSEAALNLSGVDNGRDLPASRYDSLGFDSCTHYQFVHFAHVDQPYAQVFSEVQAEWAHLDETLPFPYFPHVSMGWDNNPRFQTFRPGVMRDCTPEAIEAALRAAREYVDAHPGQPPLVTLNSWNEWTETSFLQPDDRYGYGYLDAVKRVFLEGK